jgi:malate permease and related proteins
MIVIGLGLSTIRSFRVDWRFIGICFMNRFMIWPIAVGLLYFFDIYPNRVYEALLLVAIVPLSSTTVILASLLGPHADKAATAVTLSILFALFYIPLVASIFL